MRLAVQYRFHPVLTLWGTGLHMALHGALRTGLHQTLYGHLNACNHVAFTLRGDAIASTDADGGVRIWDVRMVQERLQVRPARYLVTTCGPPVAPLGHGPGAYPGAARPAPGEHCALLQWGVLE